MSFNNFMHPRNPFKESKPNFRQLAERYERFKAQTSTDEKGKVIVDFKNPDALRALSWALLKDRFDLDVEMPLDRLIPTIPLRLNYILWIEDMLSESFPLVPPQYIYGIDIGTGASCVYALLGAKKNNWNFLSLDADPTNVEYARNNVTNNKLNDKVTVQEVSEEGTLSDALSAPQPSNPSPQPSNPSPQLSPPTYHFCMCNPPFYGSNLEAWGLETTRTDRRTEPRSVSTASPIESMYPGGEVEFVNRAIIEPSLELKERVWLELKERVCIYSTMLGKKQSFNKLKEVLREQGIDKYGWTELCQGHTMRWGLAWSFHSNVTFPKSVTQQMKEEAKTLQPVKPAHVPVPERLANLSLAQLAELIQQYLIDLQTVHSVTVDTLAERKFLVTCPLNTWSHQRRARRLLKRSDQSQHSVHTSDQSQHSIHTSVSDLDQSREESDNTCKSDQSQMDTSIGSNQSLCVTDISQDNCIQSDKPIQACTVTSKLIGEPEVDLIDFSESGDSITDRQNGIGCKRARRDEDITSNTSLANSSQVTDQSQLATDDDHVVRKRIRLDDELKACSPLVVDDLARVDVCEGSVERVGCESKGVSNTDLLYNNILCGGEGLVVGVTQHNSHMCSVNLLPSLDSACTTAAVSAGADTAAAVSAGTAAVSSVIAAVSAGTAAVSAGADTAAAVSADTAAVSSVIAAVSAGTAAVSADTAAVSAGTATVSTGTATDASTAAVSAGKAADASTAVVSAGTATAAVSAGTVAAVSTGTAAVSAGTAATTGAAAAAGTAAVSAGRDKRDESLAGVCKILVVLRCAKSSGIQINVEWLSGDNKEHLHQIAQYFKNRLNQHNL